MFDKKRINHRRLEHRADMIIDLEALIRFKADDGKIEYRLGTDIIDYKVNSVPKIFDMAKRLKQWFHLSYNQINTDYDAWVDEYSDPELALLDTDDVKLTSEGTSQPFMNEDGTPFEIANADGVGMVFEDFCEHPDYYGMWYIARVQFTQKDILDYHGSQNRWKAFVNKVGKKWFKRTVLSSSYPILHDLAVGEIHTILDRGALTDRQAFNIGTDYNLDLLKEYPVWKKPRAKMLPKSDRVGIAPVPSSKPEQLGLFDSTRIDRIEHHPTSYIVTGSIYNWIHKDGRTFSGTMHDLVAKYSKEGLTPSGLSAVVKNYRFSHQDWTTVGHPPKISPRPQNIIMRFINEFGRIFIGTVTDFVEKEFPTANPNTVRRGINRTILGHHSYYKGWKPLIS